MLFSFCSFLLMKSGSSLSTTDDVLLVLLVGGRTADQGLMVLTLQLKWRKNINRTKVMFLQTEILIVLQRGLVKIVELVHLFMWMLSGHVILKCDYFNRQSILAL